MEVHSVISSLGVLVYLKLTLGFVAVRDRDQFSFFPLQMLQMFSQHRLLKKLSCSNMYLVFVFLTSLFWYVLCVLINTSAVFGCCGSCDVWKLGVVLLLFVYIYFDCPVYFIVLFEFCNCFSNCVKNISIILIGVALTCELCWVVWIC